MNNITLVEAKIRVQKLRQILDKARYAYYVLDTPIMSDAEFDSLIHELENLEKKYPEIITSDSPTQRVGAEPLAKFKKVSHIKPMLSLEDAFSAEELSDWQSRNERFLKTESKPEYFAEVKVDGFAVSLVYENASLVYGATRGDAKTGEDVTLNLRTITAIPLSLRKDSRFYKIASHGRFEVRGEVYMPTKSFEKLNIDRKNKGLSLFANPRNAAAGSIRQLDPKIARSRDLDFFAYDIICDDLKINKHHEAHEIARDLGFKVIPLNEICKNLNEVNKFKDHLDQERKKLNYWIDGIVVVVDDLKIFNRLGIAGKAPRGMVAYKFAPEEVTTILKDVIYSIGRTGMVNPVAVLEPVLIAGSTVSRATLHNEDQIKKLDVRLGDTVVIVKAGDIIPKVLKVVKELRPRVAKAIDFPHICPGCGGKLIKKGAYWYCPDPKCYIIKRRAIGHFVSKAAFDIEGLGPQILNQLMEQGLIKKPADLFNLKVDDLKPLERFADKSAENLVNNIKAKRKIDLARFIYALGIRHVGEQTAYDLANYFKTLDKIIDANFNELNSIENIGEIVAKSIYNYFRDPKNLKDLQELRDKIEIIEIMQIKSKITGKSFCITGSLESLSREQAKERIRGRGGIWQSDVANNLDYLVVGADPGSKLVKAKKLGVKQIIEQDFLNLLK